jgi:SAM-dependent methyltransferase
MGIAMTYVREMERAGAFKDGRIAFLDIGAAHVHHASVEDILFFFTKYGKRPLDGRLRAKADDLARRSEAKPGIPITLMSEILEETTVDYLAFDVIHGPHTRIFDLNFEQLPRRWVGRFDIVCNFGTTEHVFGQYNAFKVIHDALKPGGYVYHQLPATGFFDHGYVNYNPRTFSELAAANDYEIVEFFFSEPQGYWQPADHYKPPVNLKHTDRFCRSVEELGGKVPLMPNGIINVFMRKTVHGPFRLALDRSCGGALDHRLGRFYRCPALSAPPHRPWSAVGAVKSILKSLGVKWALRQLGWKRRV